MRATRVGADSSIQRMIRLVQSADAGKAKICLLYTSIMFSLQTGKMVV